jgi:hypothetical protein
MFTIPKNAWAFCVQDVGSRPPPHNLEVSLMFKFMEVMTFHDRDTMAKACRKTFDRIG